MWLVMFKPHGGSYVPQVLCYSEIAAQSMIELMPRSAIGSYSYCFVPVSNPSNHMVYVNN